MLQGLFFSGISIWQLIVHYVKYQILLQFNFLAIPYLETFQQKHLLTMFLFVF